MVDKLQEYRTILSVEKNREIQFWLSHSLDLEHGGYFNNLDENGQVYDTTKHMWLQGREVWMWCTLYFSTMEEGHEALAGVYLNAAKCGYEFIRKYGLFDNGTRAYFALSQEGKPVAIQRKQWSECFYVLACILYGRAVKDPDIEAEGYRVFQLFLHYCKDPAVLGRPTLEGSPSMLELGESMFTLSMVDELRTAGGGPIKGDKQTMYADEVEGALSNLRKHIHDDRKIVFERVKLDGTPELSTSYGRCLNPGHSIEGGWFVIRFASKYYDPQSDKYNELKSMGLKMIDWAYDRGWDKEHGGLFYFLDSENKVPTQLEHNMKLWWPCAESMVAMLYGYIATKDANYLAKFEQVTDYSLETFSETPHGGWYGYADSKSHITSTNIGATYKGFFHVPRSLLYCVELIDEILKGGGWGDKGDNRGGSVTRGVAAKGIGTGGGNEVHEEF